MAKDNISKKMRNFPKVDLHRHLEGSMRVESFLDIARKENVYLPTYNLEEFRHLVQVNNDPPDFLNFLNKFKTFRNFYPNREAIERIAYEAVEDAAQDNVKYLELRYSPTHFACERRFREEDVIRWISGAIDRASDDYDIEVMPIVTISRDYGIELAEHTVNLAVQYAGRGLYGLDLAGDEVHNPARPFLRLFQIAKDAEMGLTLHAGEAGGSENVIEAVKVFGCDRIGHGIKAATSEEAMAVLKEYDIMLEICPTSNIHTGVVESFASHPLKMLCEKGIQVSLNSDDPMISNISLTDEYVNAVTKMGFHEEDLKRFNRMALKHSFHPDKERLQRMLAHCWS